MFSLIAAILQGGVKSYLYKDGDQCASVTGGWDGAFTRASYTITQLTYGASSMDGTFTATSQQRAKHRKTTNAIDLTPYSKVCMLYDGTLSNDAGIAHGLYVLTGNDYATRAANSTKNGTQGTNITGGIIEVDISALSGSHYISTQMIQSSPGVSLSGSLHVKEVWLE